jgi:hypothetical protein
LEEVIALLTRDQFRQDSAVDAWPPKLKLISVLSATNVFLLRSKEEGFDGQNPAQTALAVESLMAHVLEPDEKPLPQIWRILFAPTGHIQEIAMQNGWHETYMKLAAEFDELAYLVRDKTAS